MRGESARAHDPRARFWSWVYGTDLCQGITVRGRGGEGRSPRWGVDANRISLSAGLKRGGTPAETDDASEEDDRSVAASRSHKEVWRVRFWDTSGLHPVRRLRIQSSGNDPKSHYCNHTTPCL